MSILRLAAMSMGVMILPAGCMFGTPMPPGAPVQPDFDAILAVFNADLGEEGNAVTRAEVEAAFQDDPELLNAVLRDLADPPPDLIQGLAVMASAAM